LYYEEETSKYETDANTTPASPLPKPSHFLSFLPFDNEEDNMAATPREIKLCSPTPFSGDPEKTLKFLQELELYITMNLAIYDTNDKKIIFAISFMKGGTAVGWSKLFVNTAIAATPVAFGTWTVFKILVKSAFSLVDTEGKACTNIKHLKQGSGPVDDYIAQFQILAGKCRITNDKSLIKYFMDGLNAKLLEKVYMMEKMPTMIMAWYEAAAKFDGQY
jgi:Retrotransposon gag protein